MIYSSGSLKFIGCSIFVSVAFFELAAAAAIVGSSLLLEKQGPSARRLRVVFVVAVFLSETLWSDHHLRALQSVIPASPAEPNNACGETSA